MELTFDALSKNYGKKQALIGFSAELTGGIYGLLGAGRSELMECIMGLRPEHTGEVYLEGKKLHIGQTAEQIKRGLAIVPEDRQGAGLVQTMDIEKNTSLSNLKKYAKHLFLSQKAEDEDVDKVIEEIHIKVADKKLPILSLSGGNQQKVVIAKWLDTAPQILILNEPTRGVDVGAKVEIYNTLELMCKKKIGVIMISSELPEIMAIADRIIVIHEGRYMGECLKQDISQERLLSMAIGG